MKPSQLAVLATMSLAGAQSQYKLLVSDPGHFHATLLQKEMYPELDPRVSIYAPLGPDLLDYLNRVSQFNNRPDNPTRWELDVHTEANSFERMLREKPGNIVVFSGKNRGKIDRILASLSAGLHVLADKPWITDPAEMPKLERALDLADHKGLAAYDIMTERYEVTSQIMRALVNSPVFGTLTAVEARSIHHILKTVAGVPLRRPAWFFDVAEYGEGLADVGTHPVDLIQWIAFPDQTLDYHKDIHMLRASRHPLTITRAQFAQVTGVEDFPPALAPNINEGILDYYCNNSVEYTLRGSPVKLEVLWNWEASHGDVYEATFRGSRARIELRQDAAEKFIPEVYVVADSFSSLDAEIRKLQSQWPGIAVVRTLEHEARIVIPSQFRVGHEDHFGQVAAHFLQYVRSPKSMPAWERSYMLAKYSVTTSGVARSR